MKFSYYFRLIITLMVFSNVCKGQNRHSDKSTNHKQIIPHLAVVPIYENSHIPCKSCEYYFKKIADENQYYILYEGDTKLIKVEQRKNLVSKADKKALQYLRKEAATKLTLNSTIYAIKVRLKNGDTFYDYTICDAKNHEISFDDIFYYLWLQK